MSDWTDAQQLAEAKRILGPLVRGLVRRTGPMGDPYVAENGWIEMANSFFVVAIHLRSRLVTLRPGIVSHRTTGLQGDRLGASAMGALLGHADSIIEAATAQGWVRTYASDDPSRTITS